ncbi:MAG TPA: hypothetical protein DCQ84_12635 [Candidatus Competibacteraceae bacterium]|nr:hypothetical protein [Candidatus Competibacteraceae bacterium]
MRLTLEGVAKRVGAATHLYPLDFALQPHAVTVLLGATQAGKTTLMRLMAGLDAPSQGRVRVDGEDVTGRSVRERNVAMVYQQFINYPSMRVFDNIASPLKLRGDLDRAALDRRVRELAGKLHIEPFLDRLPAELSGGQQQRVAIARAIVTDPTVLLADEPTGNLDSQRSHEIMDLLVALNRDRGITVLMVTHEPDMARYAKRIVRFLDGRVDTDQRHGERG